jgi:hypothetical protein
MHIAVRTRDGQPRPVICDVPARLGSEIKTVIREKVGNFEREVAVT